MAAAAAAARRALRLSALAAAPSHRAGLALHAGTASALPSAPARFQSGGSSGSARGKSSGSAEASARGGSGVAQASGSGSAAAAGAGGGQSSSGGGASRGNAARRAEDIEREKTQAAFGYDPLADSYMRLTEARTVKVPKRARAFTVEDLQRRAARAGGGGDGGDAAAGAAAAAPSAAQSGAGGSAAPFDAFAVDIDRELDKPPRGQPAARVTSLEADPYGWEARHVKAAPLWMVYQAEREEVALKEKAGEGAKKARDAGAEIVAPMRDAQGRAYATGRRKTSVARVWVAQGDGGFTVNDRPLAEYFTSLAHRKHAMEPLIATQACGGFDVWLTVRGGGPGGQAGAVRHGLAKAMARYDPFLKPVLRRFGLLARDPRMVERKKPGQAKARKKFQWVKR